jgi:hypothetical protein
VFDPGSGVTRGTASGDAERPPAGLEPPVDLEHVLAQLGAVDGHGLTEHDQIEQITALERIKAAAAAAQARVTVTLTNTRSAREAQQGVPADRRCQGLARRFDVPAARSPTATSPSGRHRTR